MPVYPPDEEAEARRLAILSRIESVWPTSNHGVNADLRRFKKILTSTAVPNETQMTAIETYLNITVRHLNKDKRAINRAHRKRGQHET